MALISIIIGLLLDRTFRQLHELRDMTWFEYYAMAIRRLTARRFPPLQFLLIIAIPVAFILTIQVLLHDFLFNIPAVVFGIIVFMYCLGPACLTTDVDDYIHARTIGDEDEALHYAGTITGQAASTSPDQQTSDVTRAILFIANERIFGTIFWFAVLGPFGCLSYRLISQLSKQAEFTELADFAMYIHGIMAWLPARMLAIGYALTGNFDGAYHAYRDRALTADIAQGNIEVLMSAGLGAMRNLDMDTELASIYAAQALVMRAVIAWIGILAVMTLGGILN
jgi:AmpE protein